MDERLYDVCAEMLRDEEEAKKFLKIDSMDDMYEYFADKVPGLSKDDLDDFITELLEERYNKEASVEALNDDAIENVSGGAGFGAPIAASILASLTLVTGTMSALAYKRNASDNVGSSSSVITSIKDKASSVKESFANKVSSSYRKTSDWVKRNGKKVSNWFKNNPEKVAAGAAITLGTVVAGAAVGAAIYAKNKSDSNVGTYRSYNTGYRANYTGSRYGSRETQRKSFPTTTASVRINKTTEEQKKASPAVPVYTSKTSEEQKKVSPAVPVYTSKTSEEQRVQAPGVSAPASSTDSAAKVGNVRVRVASSENSHGVQKLTSNDVKQALREMQTIEQNVKVKSKVRSIVGSSVDYESWQKVSDSLTSLKRILRHRDDKFLQEFRNWRSGLESQNLPLNDSQSEKLSSALDQMEMNLRG